MTEPWIEVDSFDDDRLAPFRRNERGLASRAAKRNDAGEGLFLAEGDLVVERALAAGCVPDRALVDAVRVPAVAVPFERAGGTIFAGGEDVRRAVTGLGVTHRIIAS